MAFTIPKSQFNMPEFLHSEKARKVLILSIKASMHQFVFLTVVF